MRLRTMLAVLLGLMVSSALLHAQEVKEPKQEARPTGQEKGWITRIFELKHRDVNSVAEVVGSFGVRLRVSPRLGVMAVTGPPDVVTAVGEAIKRLDVPEPLPKNVELTVYLLAAMQQAAPEGIPKELEAVVKQLKNLFSYQGFRMVDTMIVRVRDGQGAEANGAGPPLTGSDLSQRTIYTVKCNSIEVTSDEKGNVIRLNKLRLGARIPVPTGPGNWQYVDTGFNTDIDVREGQKVVVGKANIDASNNAMILVVTAKVVG